MPQLDGLEVVRRLSADGCNAGIIFLTVHDDADFFREVWQLERLLMWSRTESCPICRKRFAIWPPGVVMCLPPLVSGLSVTRNRRIFVSIRGRLRITRERWRNV